MFCNAVFFFNLLSLKELSQLIKELSHLAEVVEIYPQFVYIHLKILKHQLDNR